MVASNSYATNDTTCVNRLPDLWAYFCGRQEDVATDVRWVAFFKFAFIIVTTGHWLGCSFYALSLWFQFTSEQYFLNWVDAWAEQTFVDYDWRTSTVCSILLKRSSVVVHEK